MQQPLRAAIYARVSTEQQTDGNTIASQIAALEARVAADGLVLPATQRFVDDGYSGATLARPALERLRDLAAAGGLDRVYVHSPDRLARRYAYQVLLIDELQRAGVEIAFLNRPIGASAEDDLLLQVQGMVAEYERAKILERSRRGKRHAALAGSVNVFSTAPYGYRYVGKQDGGGVARFEIAEDQAQVVRQIFDWVGRDRLSIGEVCRRLYRQRCPTCRDKPAWERATVWHLLRNPAYRGEAAFGKTRPEARVPRLRPMRGRGEPPKQDRKRTSTPASDWIRVPVPQIVEPAVFDAVQEQLRENSRRSRERAHGARHLLQGLLVCQSCGYSFCGICGKTRSSGGRRRTYTYYRCCSIHVGRSEGQRVCTNTPLRTDLLDAAVWQEIENVLRDPARIAAEYERRLEMARHRDTGDLNLAAVEMQLSKLRRGMGRLIDSYAEGLIERAEFEPRIAGFRQRIHAWEAQAKALQDEVAQRRTLSLILGRLEEFARRVHDRMSDLDWHQRRELVRLLVKRVEIDREQINVVLRINPPASGSDPSGTGTFLQNRSRRDRADAARCASTMYRRARSHGLAEGVGVQLACSGGVRHRAMEVRHRRWAALPNGWAASDRSGHRRRRPEPHARPWTPGVCPDRVTRNTGRARRAQSADPCNTLAWRPNSWPRRSSPCPWASEALLGLVLGVAIPPVPQAHASEEPRAYCRRVGDGDTLRPIPEALVGAAGRRLGLDAPDDVVRRMVVYRCMARAVMICGTGANLACGKADVAPARPEVAAYCRENPDAGVVPMVVAGHDAVQGWRCRAGRAEAEGPAAAIDGRGFLARNWQVLR